MRNLKKVLALVIAFSMMLSAVAFAGYQDVAADADYAGAVELLSALGIFEGDETGNFNPDKTVSRAEMAAIICRAMGVDTAAQAATKFSDVPASHWASGYIAYASAGDSPILNGVGGGKFNPSGTLTYQQALKIVVYALGFEPMANDNGGWSAGSIYVANRYKITEGADSTATRGNLAIILANAMSTPMMDKTSYGSDAKSEVLNGKNDKEYRTLLTDMDIYIATGVVGAKIEDEIEFDVTEDSDDGEFVAKKDDKNEVDFKIGASDIAAYQYQNVDAYVKKVGKKYEVVAVVANAAGETLTILSDDIYDVVGNVVEYYIDAANSDKTKKIEVIADVPVEFNTADSDLDVADFEGMEDVELVFIENDSDDKYDQIVATYYASTRVDYVEADKDRIGYMDANVKLEYEEDDVTIILEDAKGNALTLADFAEDDMIAVITDELTSTDDDDNCTGYTKYIKIVKLDDAVVTGSIDSTWEDNNKVKYVSIDGTDYVNASGLELAAGNEGTFYIGMTGKIIDFEVSTENLNYALILEAAYASSAFEDTWQVKVLTADGVSILEVDEDLVEYAEDEDFEDSDFGAIITALTGWEAKKSNELAWDQKDIDKRFVEFETNSKGQIDEIALADGELAPIASDKKEYKADTQKISGKTLEDDVIIMYVNESDAEDTFATDISFLVDEAEYAGYVFKDASYKENCVVIVTEGVSPFKAENGFAIVTKTADSKTEEGDKIKVVNYVQGEVEGVLTFGEDADTDKGAAEYKELSVGDVFMFNADANGVVSNYLVVAQYVGIDGEDEDDDADYYDFVLEDGIADAYAADKFGDDYRIATGYLYKLESGKKASSLYIADKAGKAEEFSLTSTAYRYTLNNTLRNTKIEIGDYREGDVDFYEKLDDKTKATPVIYVEIEGELVDVYTASKFATVDFED